MRRIDSRYLVAHNINTLTEFCWSFKPMKTFHLRQITIVLCALTASLRPDVSSAQTIALAITGPFTAQTTNSVNLTGLINPGGVSASVYFDYGATTNYGAQTAPMLLSASMSLVGITNIITNLLPGQVGHYRVIAVNAAGTNFGTDELFSTAGFGGAGYAINFSGTNELAGFPPQTLFHEFGPTGTNTAFTIEAWIKPINLTDNATSSVVQIGPLTGYGPPEHVTFQNAYLALGFGGHGTVLTFATSPTAAPLDVSVSPADFVDGNWHHIAGASDGVNAVLYKDGTQIGTKAIPPGTTMPYGTNFTIGGWSYFDANGFAGEIDEVRLWSLGRTHDQIVASMNQGLSGTESGLFAYYPLDNGVGTYLQNSATSVIGDRGFLTLHSGDVTAPSYVLPVWVKSTAPINKHQLSLTFINLSEAGFFQSPPPIHGIVTGALLGINSVTVTIERTDTLYWSGSVWVPDRTPLATILDGNAWSIATALPSGMDLIDSFYYLTATAFDNAGFAGRANAGFTITQGGIPAPAARLANGQVQFRFPGTAYPGPYFEYDLQVSTNLINWTDVPGVFGRNTIGIVDFTVSPGNFGQFFRTVVR